VQASISVVGQTEGDASKVSLTTMASGQASASIPSTPPTAGGAIPEVEPQEGSAWTGADAGSS
jgi:hypothetical protein